MAPDLNTLCRAALATFQMGYMFHSDCIEFSEAIFGL